MLEIMASLPIAERPPTEYLADQEGERLDVFLARRLLMLSRTAAQRLIDGGYVRVEGELERASFRLPFGAMVQIWPEASVAARAEPEAIPLDVLYEDAALIVVNKPPGLTVHPAPGHHDGTLVNALLAHWPDLGKIGDAIRPGIVHRLDKDTSGVMMAAKNEPALHHLQQQIRAHTVEKRYLAMVAGVPDPAEGSIEAPIGRDPRDPKRMAIVTGGRAARSEYHVVEAFADAALVAVRLITGRTHQIRVHLAAIGHPILGDPIYGERSAIIDRQALHAAVLAFDHPVRGDRLRFEAPLPADMQALLTALRAGPSEAMGAPPPLVRRREDGGPRLRRKRARHIR